MKLKPSTKLTHQAWYRIDISRWKKIVNPIEKKIEKNVEYQTLVTTRSYFNDLIKREIIESIEDYYLNI